MLLGIFEHLRPNHGMPTWHREHHREGYDTFDYWTTLGRMLDEAGFDFLFLADSYGYPLVDGVMPDEVARLGIQFPGYDPMFYAAAVAAATRDLGIVVTSSTMVEAPYATARRFATLDRVSGGRVGWNVVTGSSQASVAKLFGHGEMTAHDDRYAIADEFVDVAVALWESTWEDDALRKDVETRVYIDPARLHPLDHHGAHFDVEGVLSIPPTPQRTPVLFQAGTSDRGRDFAARNAEAVFVQGRTIPTARGITDDIRARAVAQGRAADDIRIVSGATVVVGRTEREALEKREEFLSIRDLDAAAVIYAGYTGIDLRAYDPDAPLPVTSTEQGQSALNRYLLPGRPVPTPREILTDFQEKSGRGFQIWGTPEQVADELVATLADSGLDGYMLEPTVGSIDAYRDFIELVLPILRERGAVPPPEHGRTLRERLFPGRGPRLGAQHPIVAAARAVADGANAPAL